VGMIDLEQVLCSYIHGASAAGTGAEREVFEPATGQVLCRARDASPDDVDRAVASAREGFLAWSAHGGAERSRVLRRAASLLRESATELARLEVRDTGKPLSEAESYDVPSAADVLDYFAGLAPTLRGEHLELGAEWSGSHVYTRREPLGVCAGIGAWNYPLQVAAWKAAPALACGNAMVMKPSELTPLTTLALARILTQAGLPPGAFNVVLGAEQTGRALVRHPGVAKVSLTGAVSTGRAVMAEAAHTLKHVTLELGGKSPLVVFADCDLDQAVSAAMNANFYTQGEVCTNGTRVFVEESVRDEFSARIRARMETIRLGDPLDPATTMGSLISAEHRDRVLGYVSRGQSEGARLHQAGTLPGGPHAGGYWVRPSLFEGCSDEMTIVREEIFGPVMSLLSFTDEDEVLERANATPFGLAAGLFTTDLRRAHRAAARLEAGVVWINNYNVTPLEMPFGGCKQSGLGRENGLAALEHYTQLKSVYVEMGRVETPFEEGS
jgi:betaine-aldehyde dehydrogenase